MLPNARRNQPPAQHVTVTGRVERLFFLSFAHTHNPRKVSLTPLCHHPLFQLFPLLRLALSAAKKPRSCARCASKRASARARAPPRRGPATAPPAPSLACWQRCSTRHPRRCDPSLWVRRRRRPPPRHRLPPSLAPAFHAPCAARQTRPCARGAGWWATAAPGTSARAGRRTNWCAARASSALSPR